MDLLYSQGHDGAQGRPRKVLDSMVEYEAVRLRNTCSRGAGPSVRGLRHEGRRLRRQEVGVPLREDNHEHKN